MSQFVMLYIQHVRQLMDMLQTDVEYHYGLGLSVHKMYTNLACTMSVRYGWISIFIWIPDDFRPSLSLPWYLMNSLNGVPVVQNFTTSGLDFLCLHSDKTWSVVKSRVSSQLFGCPPMCIFNPCNFTFSRVTKTNIC